MRSKRKMNVAIAITYRCNARCEFCDHMVNVLDLEHSDVDEEKMDKFINDITHSDLRVPVLRITGGEPTVHPRFREIVERVDNELVKAGVVRIAQINTNCTIPFGRLPSRRWKTLARPLSQKPDFHVPFGVSPLDIGLSSPTVAKTCRNQAFCGINYDYRGWTFCQPAPNLGRVLGINVFHDLPVIEMDKRVCNHCLYSLPAWSVRKIKEVVRSGQIRCPTPTIADGTLRDPALRESHRAMLLPEYRLLIEKTTKHYSGKVCEMRIVELASEASRRAVGIRKQVREHFEFVGARYFDVGPSAISELYRATPGRNMQAETADLLPWGRTDIAIMVEDVEQPAFKLRRQGRVQRRPTMDQYWKIRNAYGLLVENGMLACCFPLSGELPGMVRMLQELARVMKMSILEIYPTTVNTIPYVAAVLRKTKTRRRFPTLRQLKLLLPISLAKQPSEEPCEKN